MSQIIKNNTGGGGGGTLISLTPSFNADGTAGTPITGTAGNINIFDINPAIGLVTETINSNGTATGNLLVENRSWLTPFVVDPSTTIGSRGTYSTINAAYAAAPANSTIFLRDGTYTEDLVVTKSMNFSSLPSTTRAADSNVIIQGKFTVSTANANIYLEGMELQTNGDNIVNLTAAGAQVTLFNCYLSVATALTGLVNSGGITSNIYIYQGSGIVQGTGKLADVSAGGVTWFIDSQFIDVTGTPTACTVSNGSYRLQNCSMWIPFTTSSTGIIVATYTQWGSILTPFINSTWITTAGTSGAYLEHCEFFSGTASCISVGSGTIVRLFNSILDSTNTNVITGAGTLQYGLCSFSNTSSGINVTTQTPFPLSLQQGGTGAALTAPPQTGTFEFFGGVAQASSSSNRYRYYNDMNSLAEFDTHSSGTSATVILASPIDSGHQGLFELETGSTNAGSASISLGSGSTPVILLGGGNLYWESVVNIQNLATVGVEDYTLYFGLHDGWIFTSPPNNGFYFTYLVDTSANWIINSANGGTRTTTTSATAVASGWTKLGIAYNLGTTTATFYVNGTSIGTIATNISTNPITPTWTVFKTAGTTNRVFYIDYVDLMINFTTPR